MVSAFPKDAMSACDVAKLMNVDSRTIRYWHRLGIRGEKLSMEVVAGKYMTTKRELNKFLLSIGRPTIPE